MNFWAHTALDEPLLQVLSRARAVIFPQVVSQELYFFCRDQGIPVFPNYDLRFRFPGKLGQFLMFQRLGLPCPKTYCFPKIAALGEHPGARRLDLPPPPFVLKGNHGHEGREVFLIQNEGDWHQALRLLKQREQEGKFGFLVQEYLPAPFELRVIVCGKRLVPVWRESAGSFRANLAQGGRLISCPDRELEAQGLTLTRELVKRSGINLAAVDFLLRGRELLFNEINYVFGRQALGGSEAFYQLWQEAVQNFLKGR